MSDSNIATNLKDLLVDLSQSINIDYLAIIGEDGRVRVSAGNPGDLNRADLENLLISHFVKPENLVKPGEVGEIRIIKQGTVECIVAPINGSVQLLALASIERPSVLARSLFNEMLKARESLTGVVEKEWKENLPMPEPEQKKETIIKESTPEAGDSLESLIVNSTSGKKSKDASKFWDDATLEDQESTQNGQTISFDEARRSGLVPDDHK
jgi:hypothetical protein